MPRKKPWTLMVYLAGDNNLTEEMAWGLQELKRTSKDLGRKGRRINVVAHFDPRGSRSRRYDFLPPSPSNRSLRTAQLDGNLDKFESVTYTITDASGAMVSSDGLPNGAGDAQLLHKLEPFVRNEIDRLHNAEEFFLILSGHGSGAIGDFLIDLDPTTSLSIHELARILELGRKAYKERHKKEKRIAVLGMDSCLMSNAEVCFEVREHARYLVASEGWVSNTGWPYHRVLEAIVDSRAAKPDLKPSATAKRVADSYTTFYRDYEVAGVSTDIAVCDLDRFQPDGDLVPSLRDFAKALIPRIEAEYAQDVLSRVNVGRQREQELVEALSSEVGRALFPRGKRRDKLVDRLVHGSDGAREMFAGPRPPWHEPLSVSQLEALRQLLDAIDERYDLGEESLGDRLDARIGIAEELTQPSFRHVALAAARVLREFDPGVLQALHRIGELDAETNPMVQRARRQLQKLHQVRWLLDLRDLVMEAKDAPTPNQQPLRNTLVAARWQAQSFKGGVYVDLVDFCRCLEKCMPGADDDAIQIRRGCRAVERAVEGSGDPKRGGAVLQSEYTGPDFQHAHGLSVYFPVQARDYTPAYENLALAEQTGWGRFVRAYLCLTRVGRRDERHHWNRAAHQVLRYCEEEIDPLEKGSIEAKIAGVTGPASIDARFPAHDVRSGTAKQLRGGIEGKAKGGVEGKAKGGIEGKAKGGVEGKAKGGIEGKAKGSVESKVRGEGSLAVWGNPPDGFFRQ